MAVCRIAGYLGCAPSEVWELPAGDLDLLTRYYSEEPWGSWRDNIHAAIIAREVRQGRARKGQRVKLDDFMVTAPETRRRRHLTGLVDALKAMGGGKRVHKSEYKPPKRGKRGRSSKTGGPSRSSVGATADRAGKGKR